MPLALLVDRREFKGRPLRVSRYLQSEEAIERKKEREAATNGRRKGKKEVQRKRRVGTGKEKKEKGEEKKEKEEKEGKEKKERKEKEKKKEKQEKKEKETKKEKKEKQQPVEKKEKKELTKKKEKTKQGENTNSIDLSFMGAKAKLNTHVLKSQKKLLKKGKK